MLRLLLESDKEAIKKEYLFRFLNMLLIYITLGVFIWSFALVPSFLFVKTESDILSQQVEKQNNSKLAKDREELKKTVFDLNTKIKVLGTDEYVVSNLIRKITEKQSGEISIENISFANISSLNPVRTLELKGRADNRESLLDFSNELEGIEEFESVVLPFSNFASNENIPFLITIELKEKSHE